MRRILALITAILAAFSSPSFAAHTGTLIAASGWEGYGAPSPISGTDFFYPYQVNFPACWQITTGNNLPWDPNGVNSPDHYLQAICNNGSNPGPGTYFRERSPHRGHDLIFWFRLDTTVTTQPTFIVRFNDSTAQANTGVYRGAIDYTAPSVDTANKLVIDGNVASSAFTVGTWTQVEICYIAGINGSGTIPTAAQAWVNGASVISFTPGTTTPNGGGDTITFDQELGNGAGGQVSFGPWADYDPGTSCPASPLATLYYVGAQPKSNSSVQFTPQANTNWQNAAATSPGALSYNFDSTSGHQDLYNQSLGVFGAILAITNRVSIELDNTGVRTGLPLYNNGSTTSTCPIGNGFSLGGGGFGAGGTAAVFSIQNGTYQSDMCSSDVDPFTGVAWTTTTGGKVGIQDNP